MAPEGKMKPDSRKIFFKHRLGQEKRVYKNPDGLSTTLNNAGTQNFESLSWFAGIIIVDEAGQWTLLT
ncbi:MAG: hypothetical protein Q9170_003554, partial [Blastenia crenularia]